MLVPAWYLPDTDWFAQLRDAPQPAGETRAVLDRLDHLLRDEPAFGPDQTVAATYVILLGVEHLGDAMAHAAGVHDLGDVVRLLCGLNLAVAHLTQTVQRIAGHADDRSIRGLDRASGGALDAFADHLGAAGASGEILAGHLKEAHLLLRTFTTQ
ncbi:hypothetical protein AB0C12_43055 [Actinoplanes sp. NPDC048967]|uniref:hypothetical protein n=1 Tax=Actinoplanes sp. NPDC048967 TaxID=3155269 RepID=UPI00340E1068